MNKQLIKNILTEELFGSKICESVEDIEIIDYFYKSLLLEKFLYGEPISVPELRKLLRQKILNFEFIKLDGHIRPARGTTMSKHIPAEDTPKGIKPSSDAVATFYDLDKKAWRSVSKKSKELVIKKDEEKNRPVIVVQDKGAKDEPEIEDTEKLGQEPIDEIQPGQVRNYLNRNGKNILIRIKRIDDEGIIYAETVREKTPFMVPPNRNQNIGEITSLPAAPEVRKAETPVPEPETEVVKSAEMKPVGPDSKEGDKEIIELVPVDDDTTEEIDDTEDADELIR